MTIIKDATNDWSASVTPASDEIWQARTGVIYVTTTTSPAPDDGLLLVAKQGVLIRAGNEVRYRKQGSTDAVLVREAV